MCKNMNCYDQLSDKEKLNVIGCAVDKLVKVTDKCFKLSDEEKSIIAQYAMHGVTKVFDNRYKVIHNRLYINKQL